MTSLRRAAIEEFIRHMATAVSTATLYPLEHAQVTELISMAHRRFREAIADEEEISLMRLEENLVADGTPLERGLYMERFARMLKNRGIGHLRISRRVEGGELLDLVGALARKRSAEEEVRSSENLRLGTVVGPRGGAGGRGMASFISEAGFEGEDFARLADFYDQTRRRQGVNAVGISDIVSNFIHALSMQADPLLVLAPLRDMDEYTFAHSVNVCLLNLAQARALGIAGPLLRDIGVAALLHDIGKLFIPEEIINKPGKLDSDEWELVRRHPALGAKYLLAAKGVPRLAVLNAYEHHLRFDCTGYPRVDEYWQQNLSTHMTTLSDIVDSMLTRRSYRDALGVEIVTATLSEYRGNHLHPYLVDSFLRLLDGARGQTPEP